MKRILLFVSFSLFALMSSFAEQAFVTRIPNGTAFSCANCHINPAGDGPRNSFGLAFNSAGKRWTANLAKLDSDGDGASNGLELQDPSGTWTTAKPAPGNVALVTNPSDPNDFPTSVEEFLAFSNLVVSPIPASNYLNFSIKSGVMGKITINIFDITGLLINTFTSENSNGEYNFGWNLLGFNAAPVSNGYYFAEVKQNNYVEKIYFVVAR
jgi:hypothetical protein